MLSLVAQILLNLQQLVLLGYGVHDGLAVQGWPPGCWGSGKGGGWGRPAIWTGGLKHSMENSCTWTIVLTSETNKSTGLA